MVNFTTLNWVGSLLYSLFSYLFIPPQDDNNWNRFRRGKPPPERFNFGSVLIGSKLYVFGGNLDPQTEQCTKELWVADLSSVY